MYLISNYKIIRPIGLAVCVQLNGSSFSCDILWKKIKYCYVQNCKPFSLGVPELIFAVDQVLLEVRTYHSVVLNSVQCGTVHRTVRIHTGLLSVQLGLEKHNIINDFCSLYTLCCVIVQHMQ